MHGTQSAPSLIKSNLDKKTDLITDDDIKFVEKVSSYLGESMNLEQFFRKYAADETGLMGEAEFEKLCMAIRFKTSVELRHQVMKNISSSISKGFGYTEFHKYFDLVKLKVERNTFDPRQEITKFAKELCLFLEEHGYLLEEIIQEHKKVKTVQGLSLSEFTSLTKTIGSKHFDTPESVQFLFDFLARNKKIVTFEDIKETLGDYESVKVNIFNKKDAIIKQNLNVG